MNPGSYWAQGTLFRRFAISCHDLGIVLGRAMAKAARVFRIDPDPGMTAIGQRAEFNESGGKFAPAVCRDAYIEIT